MARVLWVGGTSALTRTYFEDVHPARGVPKVIVAAPCLPSWSLPDGATFVELDLMSEKSVATIFSRLPHPVEALVLGVRLSLVWARPEQHEQLAQHVGLLVQLAAWHGCKSVLHISSIAVADHVTAQHLVREDDPVPPLEELSSPYDRFKLRCEQIVDATCTKNAATVKVWVNLRLSGLFSNDPACIQCTAVRRQWLLSVRSLAAIDFNSSRNVSMAIALVLERMHTASSMEAAPRPPNHSLGASASSEGFTGGHLFYYTRSTKEPAPYWYHVRDYRRAHRVWYGVFLPSCIADLTFRNGRRLMQAIGTPLASSLDYLIAVASAEHSADNSRFRAAFPSLEGMEETVEDAFLRIRKRRQAERAATRQPVRSLAAAVLMLLALLVVAVAVGLESPHLTASFGTHRPAHGPTTLTRPTAAPLPAAKWWDATMRRVTGVVDKIAAPHSR